MSKLSEQSSDFDPNKIGKSENENNTETSEGKDKNGLNDQNIHYEGDKCIYTDPSTKSQMEWNIEKQEWVPRHLPQNPPNENYIMEGDTYKYVDRINNQKYKWDKEKNTWISDNEKPVEGEAAKMKKDEENLSQEKDSEEESEDEDGNIKKKERKRQDMSKGIYGYENDTHTFTDSTDGTVYLWDKEKNAWFPKVDEDFLAQYQMSYGFVAPNDEEEIKVKEESPKKIDEETNTLKRKAAPPQQPTWFEVDPENNNKVYVSNLPIDITEQEFVDLMQKCGLVMKDADSGRMKIKLYTEPGTNQLKGDALCTYIKIESVELALKILDGYEFKGKNISVERAKFTMKGNSYDPTLKPKKKRRKDKEKIRKMQERLFDWHPDKLRGQRNKSDRVVIVKNLFEPSIFDDDVGLILEYQQDIREECSKCGDVRKVKIYDRHPEGVAQIIFKEPEAADACIVLLNNRWFGKRQITAETWDGKAKYQIAETEEEGKERLNKWSKFLQKNEELEKMKENEEESQRESDQDTRSSAGSGDETEDEAPP